MSSFRNIVSRARPGPPAGPVAGLCAPAVAEPAAGPVTVVGGAVLDRMPARAKDFAIRAFGENDKTVLRAGFLSVVTVGLGVVALRHRRAGATGIPLFGAIGTGAAPSRPDAGPLALLLEGRGVRPPSRGGKADRLVALPVDGTTLGSPVEDVMDGRDAMLAAEDTADTWRQWPCRWNTEPGGHTLTVRAADGTAQVRTEQRTGTVPDGASGRDSAFVTVIRTTQTTRARPAGHVRDSTTP